ncbi:site-specific integrase [Methylobacterium sp. WL7]|uniref:site-specific integrase n=1 Tax=Methylobacterium sp. WL7 TaxID=2603900 RepID=UPI0011C95829|nr:site-specific integrase [Methylobacterium sp. WL7]TXN40022.1 tyrosine-type recombinase/integrase [Methylobacterium sp. WL7]
MSTEVALPSPTGLQAFADRAREYADQSRVANTRRAYASDVRAFARWCEARGEASLPASLAAILAYLIDHATTLKVVTLQRRLAAALRRSELAELEVARKDGAAWIEERPDGLVVHLARSKTDQQAEGVEIGVPYGSNIETCPVRSYRAWIQAACLKEGPVFRPIDRHGRLGTDAVTDRAVARIVQRSVEAAALAAGHSLEEASRLAAGYAGHPLRSGLATSAAANDAPGHAIQRQLRHKRFDTTSGYIRSGQLFKQNPAGMAGL